MFLRAHYNGLNKDVNKKPILSRAAPSPYILLPCR